MMLKLNCYLLLLFFITSSLFGQDDKPETIFITESDPNEKQAGEKYFFGQLSLSVPVRANPYSDDYEDDDYQDPDNSSDDETGILDLIIPNGINVHFGYGFHYKKWVGISANTGIDWVISEKLVAAPVYGSFIFNPQIWEETNVYLQAGYGKTFALGRGSLTGTYQKYRLGVMNDNFISVYLEANFYGFPLYEMEEAGSFCVGISFFDFL